MERDHKLQTNSNRRLKRVEVRLDRRYSEIGISAVAAAVQCRGGGPQTQSTQEANNMTSKQQSKSDHQKKFNLGQREASQEQEKDAKLRHMGELSKEAKEEQNRLKVSKR